MDRELISTSKFLSLVLRHRPEKIGLRLDSEGWVEIDELLAATSRSGRKLTRPLLEQVVRENDKQRFTISIDGQRIRASQGHSVIVDLSLQPVEPPVHRQEVYDAILRSGETARCSTVLLPNAGSKALATIRSQIASSLPDDGTLIAAILEVVAAKGITAEDLSSFVKEI